MLEILIFPTQVKFSGKLDCPMLKGGTKTHSPSNSMEPEPVSIINSSQNEETQLREESSLCDTWLAQTMVNTWCIPGGMTSSSCDEMWKRTWLRVAQTLTRSGGGALPGCVTLGSVS